MRQYRGLLLLLLLAGGDPAQARIPHAARAPASLPAVVMSDPQRLTWQMTSAITGEAYQVEVFIPSGKPPEGGFPVIYVLDGGALFGTFSDAVKARGNAGELQKAVVVGIDGAKGPKEADRYYDFTPTDLTDQEKRLVVDADPNARHGGAEPFFQVIEREIKPQVAQRAPVNPRISTLFGWSLGGQFVLHTLFNHPDAYQIFIALSPSIWWGGRATLEDEPKFWKRVETNDLHPRLFIGVGANEQEMPAGPLPAADAAKLKPEIDYARMVDNARDLAADLAARDTGHHLALVSQIFDGQSHNSVPWAAINPLLNFAISHQ